MNSKALDKRDRTPEEILVSRFRNILSFCGVQFEGPDGIIVRFPVPEEPDIKIAGESMYHKPKTISCRVELIKGRVFLRAIETKHGYHEGKLFNPRSLIMATEIWRKMVAPAIDRKKERVKAQANGK